MVASAVRKGIVTVILCIVAGSVAFAAGLAPVKAGPKDKCPVCGMFVSKYPDFAAQVRFKDGSTFHFDGAKDMFKYYREPQRYTPGRKQQDIAAVFVTDYYSLNPVDGRTAAYVAGSDVLGPMGRELIPFARISQAQDFMKDHKGKRVLKFDQVTPAVIEALDR